MPTVSITRLHASRCNQPGPLPASGSRGMAATRRSHRPLAAMAARRPGERLSLTRRSTREATMTQLDTHVATAAPPATRRSGRRRAPQWLLVFGTGLLLWVATVVVTFTTQNTNLIPAVILIGSFLVPVTFVSYALARADAILTTQRIFVAFVCGGLLGVLGASLLEAAFIRGSAGWTWLWVA